jgi:hypothetical protein
MMYAHPFWNLSIGFLPHIMVFFDPSSPWDITDGTRDRFKITSKANDKVREEGLNKFKTNPTKRIGKRGYWLIVVFN